VSRRARSGAVRARVLVLWREVCTALDGIAPDELPGPEHDEELALAMAAAADALIPADAIPVVGPVIEAIDGVVLRLLAVRIAQRIRQRRDQAGGQS
jgi:hypothetical protein